MEGERGKNQWTWRQYNRIFLIWTKERKQTETNEQSLKKKKKEQSLRDIWDDNKRSNTEVIRVS